MSTILLVDSDPFKAAHYRSMLERGFSDVVRVVNASEALCLVEQQKFAAQLRLVVSDLNMIGVTGSEFVAELNERLPRVPFLVLGNRSVPAPDRFLRYLPRPFSTEQLLSAANRLLAERALLQTA